MDKKTSNELTNTYIEQSILSYTGDSDYNPELLVEALSQLQKEGLLESAQKLYLDKRREYLEDSVNACNKLFDILKDFNVWKIGKYDSELKELVRIISEKDVNYELRTNLYEELISLPQYNKLSDKDKLKVAMKLGALDISELVSDEIKKGLK